MTIESPYGQISQGEVYLYVVGPNSEYIAIDYAIPGSYEVAKNTIAYSTTTMTGFPDSQVIPTNEYKVNGILLFITEDFTTWFWG